MTARLITIPISHYCEKARWALDRAGVAYREEGHVPFAQMVYAKWTGGRRTVPVLVTSEGNVLNDSTDIVRYADERLEDADRLLPAEGPCAKDAADLEDTLDERFGPHTRRLGYHYLLPEKRISLGLLSGRTPRWELGMLSATFGLGGWLMRRLLKIDAGGVARSRERVLQTFDALDERLADGRPWLCGERFTAADLTLAALGAPVVIPPGQPVPMPVLDALPAPLAALARELQARPAGQLVLRAYERRHEAACAAPTN